MKYIFIVYIFRVINIDTFHYKFGQTSNHLTENKSKWTLFAGQRKYVCKIMSYDYPPSLYSY
jgi:hypothetical protein